MKNHLLFELVTGTYFRKAIFLNERNTDHSKCSFVYLKHSKHALLIIAGLLLMIAQAHAQWENLGPAEITMDEAQFQSLAFNNNNVPHVVFRDLSQNEKTSLMYYNYTEETWYYLGDPGFSDGGITTSQDLAFSPDGTIPYVVYEDNDIVNKSIVMRYFAGSWQVVGPLDSEFNEPGVPERNTSFQSIAIHPGTGQVFVAFQAEQRSSKAMVWKLVGSPGSDGWEFLGMNETEAAFSDGEAREIDLAIHPTTGEPYVAYRDMSNSNGITVHRFDGTDWQVVGTKGFTLSADKPSLAFHPDTNEPYVAYSKNTNPNGIAIMRFDGTNWVPVGNAPFTPKAASSPSMAFHPVDHQPYVAFSDFDQGNKLTVMRFNGSEWEILGMQGISMGASAFNSLAFNPGDNEPYVAFMDEGNPNNGMSVVKFTCTNPNVPDLSATSTEICEGESTDISIGVSDELGSATSWFLYSGSCGGTLVDNNETGTFTVMPTSTTTFFVRGEGGCISGGSCDEITITVNPLPTVNAGEDDTYCAGESITLEGSGDASSYSWDNDVIDGEPFVINQTSTFTVTGTDANGCTNTDEVTITVNDLPNVDAGEDQSICEGESVTLTATGASSYTWDNGVNNGETFTPENTTSYTVTGTDENGCVAMDEVMVTVNPLPIVSAGEDIEVCEGEMVTLNGNGAETYNWDNGVTDGETFEAMTTTTYTVTGTDANGCTDTDEIVVTVNEAPEVDAGEDQTVCEGESVTLTGSGAESYSWDKGVTDGESFIPTETSTYTLLGTGVNGCTATDEVVISVETIDNTVTFAANTLTVSATDASYQWIDCNSSTAINGENNQDFVPMESGTFAVEITRNGCTVTTECMEVIITGIDDIDTNLVRFFPNPSEGVITLTLDKMAEEIQLVLMNSSSQLIKTERFYQSSEIELSIDGPAGIYLLRLNGNEFPDQVFKVIKH